jgi:hypothetical protein
MNNEPINQGQSNVASSIAGAPPPSPPQTVSSGAPTTQSSAQPPPIQSAPQPTIQAPPAQTAAPSGLPTPTAITTQPPKRFSKTQILFTILIIATVIIWGSVAYLYLQNQKIKDQLSSEKESSEQLFTTVTPTPVPTVAFSPDQIELVNGSVVRKFPNGELGMLIDKEDYESTGITGFARVTVSPNDQKLCFESWPPAPEPALYYSDIEGGNVNEVSPNRKNCIWSSDSKSLIYTNDSTPSASIDIYIYDIATGEENNMTKDSSSETVSRQYEIVSLSADGSKVICKYVDLDKVTQEK